MARPADVALRMFKPGDEATLVRIWNATYTHDPIGVDTFGRQTLADPNFSVEGCWLAECAGEPSGFVLAVAPGVPHLFAPPPGNGRITGLGVVAEHRRGRIGSRLLDCAVNYLGKKGCGRMVVASPEYYVAGVDRDAYPDGLAFLAARRFAPAGEAVAMGRELYELEVPAEVKETEARLAMRKVEVKFFEQKDAPALAGFFEVEFNAWKEFFERKMKAGDPLDDIVIARDSNHVLGYCQRLEADHVGPFGVVASLRDQGVGSVMLYRLLNRMREKGYRFAWFGETGRARPFYERAGFKVTRRYSIMSREL